MPSNRKILSYIILTFCSIYLISAEEEKLPSLGDASSSAISLSTEYSLGRLWLAQMRNGIPQIEDSITQDYLEHLLYRLSEYSQLKDRRLELILIDQNTINAFAAPGGVIGVNGGLINQAETEAQLVSVLSHELAHLSQRHFARNLQRQQERGLANAFIILASIAVAAASSPDAVMAGQQILAQQALAYSRSNEQEADRIGFLNLTSAGFNPEGMPNMFRKLQDISRLSGRDSLEFLRSHPVTKSRISDSQNRANKIKSRNFNDSLEYYLIKQRVRVHFSSNLRQSITYYKQAVRKSKSEREKVIYNYGLALALSRDGKNNEALEMIRLSLNLKPKNLILQSSLLEIHFNAGHLLEAKALGKELLATNTDNYPLSMLYARILMDSQDYEEAEGVLKNLLTKRSTDLHVWYWLAEIQGLSRNTINLHRSRAEYFSLRGRYDEAIKHLRYALELVGNNFQLTQSIESRIEDFHVTKRSIKELS
ncbi:MAG: M48 family metalloprotease [SAR86 cluster bacterium]|jgi:beta-barrel assembly-enhancing protease|nr:M48 family metalloprotease [SAR86 cluster bacterium]